MAEQRPRRVVRRVLLVGLGLFVIWLVGVWPPPVWWKSHWPAKTAMMRLHADGAHYAPTPLDSLPQLLRRMVLTGEDWRFRTHHGLDFAEIRDALGLDRGAGLWPTLRRIWQRRDRLRGASTITQQLAKNLYLSPSRNPFRKLKEAVTAVRLELALSKDRILELYLNLVELGPGVWGMPAASERYFSVPPSRLTEVQAAALAATLPFPLSSNPAHRPARMLRRRDLILARSHGVNVYIPPGELEAILDSSPVPESLPAPTTRPTIRAPSVDSVEPDSTRAPADTSARDSLPDSSDRPAADSVSPRAAAASPALGSWPGRPNRPARSSPPAPAP